MASEEINQATPTSLSEEEKAVDDFILQTLSFIPLFYIKTQKYIAIKAYAVGANEPSMQIFRMISRYDLEPDKDLLRVGLQDEINMIIDGKASGMKRWQVNFSILVDKETYTFHSIADKPKKITHALESINVFQELSREKGAIMYVGDWKFESDGNGWVRMDRDGKPVEQLDKALLLMQNV